MTFDHSEIMLGAEGGSVCTYVTWVRLGQNISGQLLSNDKSLSEYQDHLLPYNSARNGPAVGVLCNNKW